MPASRETIRSIFQDFAPIKPYLFWYGLPGEFSQCSLDTKITCQANVDLRILEVSQKVLGNYFSKSGWDKASGRARRLAHCQ
jgi:hypothetical protein